MHVLIHYSHPLLFSHEPFHSLLVVLILHLLVGSSHNLSHSLHHVTHRLVNAHLLQFESDVLELSIEFVILGYHLVVFEDLLGQYFLGLCALFFFDLLLEIFLESFALVLNFHFLALILSAHAVDFFGVILDLLF